MFKPTSYVAVCALETNWLLIWKWRTCFRKFSHFIIGANVCHPPPPPKRTLSLGRFFLKTESLYPRTGSKLFTHYYFLPTPTPSTTEHTNTFSTPERSIQPGYTLQGWAPRRRGIRHIRIKNRIKLYLKSVYATTRNISTQYYFILLHDIRLAVGARGVELDKPR